MVASALMGVVMSDVVVVPLFSFVCFLYLFVIRVELCPLVPRLGFCVDLGFSHCLVGCYLMGGSCVHITRCRSFPLCLG